ncbi:MAG: molecular chaperone HtpG [Clostridia bacterium]|nr:molecular chaperone HtpG [Clostridia bacterium]
MTEEFASKKGGISVQTEHIFPVIKRWLYSDKDIFLREIVSNASDAITKLKRLEALGHITLDADEDFRINITVSKSESTITVEDNGIGMTNEELEKYICQIALSGALEFISQYEGDGENDSANGIIGHFGLGFYSSFMVSDTVELFTKSYTGAPAVHWSCDDSGEYEITECDKKTKGTKVVMHVSESEKEYLEGDKIREILNTYCAFMPIDIYLDVEGEEHGEGCDCEECHHEHEDGCECDECHYEEKPVNDKSPLWLKQASECTPEMYNEFYHKVFKDARDPLFYIHINADFPLNFKGILFFPRLDAEYESLEGQVKLYYNQVFVADNIKEVIPDYLLMLRGVLDCPELPLNVSRSYLQNNVYIKKVAAHIVKKVADKLNALCNVDRDKYESIWDDIHLFVEYACMRDNKFYEKVKPSLLLRITDKSFMTIEEYLEAAKEANENVIYYTSDVTLQAQYVSMLNAAGIKVAIFDKPFETQFISMLEGYGDEIKFVRVDSDIADALKSGDEKDEDEALTALFRTVSGNDALKVEICALRDESIPAFLTVTEESRRMEEMMKMYARSGMSFGQDSFPLDYTLRLNRSSSIISRLKAKDGKDAEQIADYIYRLACLANRKLSTEEMKDFLNASFEILSKL